MLIVRNSSICCYTDVGYSEFQLHSNLHVAYTSVQNHGYLSSYCKYADYSFKYPTSHVRMVHVQALYTTLRVKRS